MNIKNGNVNSLLLSKPFTLFTLGNPMPGRMYEAEITNRYENQDPHKPPEPKNNDVYVPLFAIIGAFLGGWLGSFGNSFVFFLSILAGAAIGAFTGNSIKNWLKRRSKAGRKEE